MKAVSLLLADDHPVVREGCRRLLERQPGFSVCAEAVDADGLDALRHIRQRDADARALMVTMHSGASMALKVLEAGAWGYVTKSSGQKEQVRSDAQLVWSALSAGLVRLDDVSAALPFAVARGRTHD